MRFRTPLFVFLIIVYMFVLPATVHASVPFFGPIIPTANNRCAAGWGMLITVVNNLIQFLLTIVIVFVAPLAIAYSGFLFMWSQGNAGHVTKAVGILTNTVVGILVAFCGWVIVDAVMAALYNPGAFNSTWADLIGSGGSAQCLIQEGQLQNLNQAKGAPGVSGVSATGQTTLSYGTGACDAATVQQAAAAGGYTLTTSQANTFACIARPESTCGTVNLNYSWNKPNENGLASTAAGPFQVLLSTNHVCYENPACQRAAGVNGTLNCQKGFGKNGFTAGGDPTVLDYCVRAAANLDCSASAAACLLQQNNGNFSPWQKDVNSAKQTGCINANG